MASNNKTNVVEFTSAARGATPGRRLIPSRLKDARIAKQLNQAELGAAIGKTRQAISAYEMGEKSPEAATLADISAVLGQPLSFFTVPDREGFGPFGTRFYRASGADTKRRNLMCDTYANWQVQISRYVSDVVNYPPVSLPSIEPADPTGAYDEEEIEDAAAECRKLWGLGYGPISNMISLAEGKGIITARLVMPGENVEAFSFWNGPRPFIFLASEKESASRARFDVAHEIAHLILHRGVGPEDIEDPRVLKRIETEANRFAGALLLPRQSFPHEVFTTRLDAFVELKARWKVAIQAMVYRCKDLGTFDEYQVTNLYKQISARKWRKKEPLDDPNKYPLEEPKLLRKALSMIFEAGARGPEDINADIALSPEIIEILCNLERGSLTAQQQQSISYYPTLK
jgi:Zn-dependent peptidase ImmA (M78 family)/transcriptional regulator with XRE-family HTH domain